MPPGGPTARPLPSLATAPPAVACGSLATTDMRATVTHTASGILGIGLAIVRQICEGSEFDITYEYEDGLHGLAVSFLPRVSASKLLQNLLLPLHSQEES